MFFESVDCLCGWIELLRRFRLSLIVFFCCCWFFFFESTKNYGLPRTFARLMRFHVERWYTVFCFQCAFHWSSWFKFWRAIKLNNVFQTTDWISQLRNKKQSAQRFLVSFLCYVIVMSLPSKTYIIMYSRSPSHAKQSQYLKEGKWIVAIKP